MNGYFLFFAKREMKKEKEKEKREEETFRNFRFFKEETRKKITRTLTKLEEICHCRSP